MDLAQHLGFFVFKDYRELMSSKGPNQYGI